MSLYTLLRDLFAVLLIHECVCDGQKDRLALRVKPNGTLSTRTLHVTSILTSPMPYLLLKPGIHGREFEGFIPDLLEEVSRLVSFNYTIRLVRDAKYGSKLPDGSWNGMIGEITRMEADIAAAPLTVTSIRMRVVDFTYPFIGNNYLAALVKKRHSRQAEVHSPRDLSRQSTIKYGVVDAGSTKDHIRSSKDSGYSQMWVAMSRNADSFVRTIEEGVNRVIASSDEHPWAFISESTTLEYYAGRRCELEVVMDPHTPLGGMALAVPIGSPYRKRMNLAVMEMLESGRMGSLRRKWWPTTVCRRHSATSGASRIVSPLHSLRYIRQALSFISSVNF